MNTASNGALMLCASWMCSALTGIRCSPQVPLSRSTRCLMVSTCSGHWSMSVTSCPALVSSPPTTEPMAPAPMMPILMNRPSSVDWRWRGATASRRVGVDPVLLELLPQRVAVDAEELGSAHLVAPRLAHDGPEQRLLDQPDHQAVQIRRAVAAQTADTLLHLLLDDVL